MPELPDVEVFARTLGSTGLGRTVTGVEVLETGVLDEVSAGDLDRALSGHRLEATRRHGKLLFVATRGGPWLVVHFGMSGSFTAFGSDEDPPHHARVLFTLDDGTTVAFVCPRKLGRVGLADDPEARIAADGLGPDPLAEGFSAETFRRRLAGRRGMVKTALMNQSVVAGLGNEYSDELLFQAGIHPRTPVAALDGETLEGLYRRLADIVERAVAGGTEDFPDGWLITRREAGTRCPRCGGEIERLVVSGRGCYLCPDHQRSPEGT